MQFFYLAWPLAGSLLLHCAAPFPVERGTGFRFACFCRWQITLLTLVSGVDNINAWASDQLVNRRNPWRFG